MILFHLSLRNLFAIILAKFFRVKTIIKSDHNLIRTNAILNSKPLKQKLYKWLIENTDEIIIETEYNKKILEKVLNDFGIKHNLKVEHNKVFTKSEFEMINCKTNENIAAYYLRFPDNPDEQKNCGLDIFLRSIYFNPEFFQKNKIIIFGQVDDWLKEYIINQFGSLANIKFVGHLNRLDLIRLLARSKYYILTSREESFHLTAIEAILSNCELISTHTGVCRDLDMVFTNEIEPYYQFNTIKLEAKNYVYDFD